MLSVCQTTHREMLGLVNNEWERMWQELIVDWFNVLYQQLSEMNEENHENPQSE
jgi:hypothetical protein